MVKNLSKNQTNSVSRFGWRGSIFTTAQGCLIQSATDPVGVGSKI